MPILISAIDVKRFWDCVNKNGPIHPEHGQCWQWTKSTCPGGYGQFRAPRSFKVTRASRFMWAMVHGRKVPDHLHVLHKCDNPSCVNPDHLFLGTDNDNVQDMMKKGRNPNREGSNNGRAIINEEIVRYIRKRYVCRSFVDGAPAIARDLGLDTSVVYRIAHRQLWDHVTDEVISKEQTDA